VYLVNEPDNRRLKTRFHAEKHACQTRQTAVPKALYYTRKFDVYQPLEATPPHESIITTTTVITINGPDNADTTAVNEAICQQIDIAQVCSRRADRRQNKQKIRDVRGCCYSRKCHFTPLLTEPSFDYLKALYEQTQ